MEAPGGGEVGLGRLPHLPGVSYVSVATRRAVIIL
jgi:hypothetical protein